MNQHEHGKIIYLAIATVVLINVQSIGGRKDVLNGRIKVMTMNTFRGGSLIVPEFTGLQTQLTANIANSIGQLIRNHNVDVVMIQQPYNPITNTSMLPHILDALGNGDWMICSDKEQTASKTTHLPTLNQKHLPAIITRLPVTKSFRVDISPSVSVVMASGCQVIVSLRPRLTVVNLWTTELEADYESYKQMCLSPDRFCDVQVHHFDHMPSLINCENRRHRQARNVFKTKDVNDCLAESEYDSDTGDDYDYKQQQQISVVPFIIGGTLSSPSHLDVNKVQSKEGHHCMIAPGANNPNQVSKFLEHLDFIDTYRVDHPTPTSGTIDHTYFPLHEEELQRMINAAQVVNPTPNTSSTTDEPIEFKITRFLPHLLSTTAETYQQQSFTSRQLQTSQKYFENKAASRRRHRHHKNSRRISHYIQPASVSLRGDYIYIRRNPILKAVRSYIIRTDTRPTISQASPNVQEEPWKSVHPQTIHLSRWDTSNNNKYKSSRSHYKYKSIHRPFVTEFQLTTTSDEHDTTFTTDSHQEQSRLENSATTIRHNIITTSPKQHRQEPYLQKGMAKLSVKKPYTKTRGSKSTYPIKRNSGKRSMRQVEAMLARMLMCVLLHHVYVGINLNSDLMTT